jgi:hypothetical protein
MAPRKRSDWPGLLADSMTLGLNANLVIALRLAKIAWGGPAAKAESLRMVEEKRRSRRLRRRIFPRRKPCSRARRTSRPSAP